jgi:hypothetical protein
LPGSAEGIDESIAAAPGEQASLSGVGLCSGHYFFDEEATYLEELVR